MFKHKRSVRASTTENWGNTRWMENQTLTHTIQIWMIGIFQAHKTENENKSSQITTSKGNHKTKRREKTKRLSYVVRSTDARAQQCFQLVHGPRPKRRPGRQPWNVVTFVQPTGNCKTEISRLIMKLQVLQAYGTQFTRGEKERCYWHTVASSGLASSVVVWTSSSGSSAIVWVKIVFLLTCSWPSTWWGCLWVDFPTKDGQSNSIKTQQRRTLIGCEPLMQIYLS